MAAVCVARQPLSWQAVSATCTPFLVHSRHARQNQCQLGSRGPRCTTRHLSHFRVIEHHIPAGHIRQWPRGSAIDKDEPLKLAVKQYVPLDQEDEPGTEGITFIGAHANGFPKETYEPLWDNLFEKMKASGDKRIRSIWIADVASQGQSGVLNEQNLGNDPSWYDHSRDLLYLINQKHQDIRQPIVGIGHSMGGSHLTHLALMHPGLFQALILIDPVIQTENPSRTFAPASTYRRDLWPSREFARQKFENSKFYQAWDPRVLDKWVEFGLRDLPTAAHPDRGGGKEVPVTLTTTVSQEVFLYLRPKYNGDSSLEPEANKLEYGDMHPEDIEKDYPFYRPEPAQIFRRLPELYPPVLYIFGNQSVLATPELRLKKLETTGTGVGGSGGQKNGRVEELVLDCGHLVPFEKTVETADAAARFATAHVSAWKVAHDERKRLWLQKPYPGRVSIDDQWREKIGARAPQGSKKSTS